MEKVIVGKIQAHDVYYLPERDLVFCKNTVIPYTKLKEVLLENPVDKYAFKEDIIMTRATENVIQFACLTTNIENIKEINNQIKKIRNGRRIN